MAKLKITLELDLEEIKNLSYLFYNTKRLLEDIDSVSDHYLRTGIKVQNSVLERLDSFIEQIDPLVEN